MLRCHMNKCTCCSSSGPIFWNYFHFSWKFMLQITGKQDNKGSSLSRFQNQGQINEVRTQTLGFHLISSCLFDTGWLTLKAWPLRGKHQKKLWQNSRKLLEYHDLIQILIVLLPCIPGLQVSHWDRFSYNYPTYSSWGLKDVLTGEGSTEKCSS